MANSDLHIGLLEETITGLEQVCVWWGERDIMDGCNRLFIS